MSDATSDTEVAGAEDTVAATDAPARDTGGKIRGSRPSLAPGPDYPTLTTVDPAHYTISRELARGGMGRIQLAHDRRLGRDVAVKELLVQSGAVARRFEREARITARLSHPSIVAVHEAGVWPSGEAFYAMRLVPGRSLDDAIGAAKTFEGRLALLPHVLAVADAIAYAHGQRVIHRDLKPRNVLVGEFGETVVIDWGLAKELDATLSSESIDTPAPAPDTASSSAGETTAGDVLGTPAYMPPEQAAGDVVDERADVYAIGAMLYQLLAGEAPFTGDTSPEILTALRAGPPRPIAKRAPHAPGELVAIVERAMARDPSARYPTAREIAEDLRKFQTGQLVGAHRYSMRQLLRRWARRHRTAIIAIAAAAAAGIAIGVFALTRVVAANRVAEEQRALAEQQRASAEQSRASAEELMGFMLGDLKEKLRRVGRLDVMDAVATKAADYYDRRIGGSDEDIYLSAEARGTLAEVFHSRGDEHGSKAQLEKERAMLETLVTRDPDVVKYRVTLAAVRSHLADVQMTGGDLAPALAACRSALADIEPVLATHPDDRGALHAVLYLLSDIAWIHQRQGDTAAAVAEYRHALALAKSHDDGGERSAKDILDAHASLGQALLRDLHDYPAALVEYRAGLDLGTRELAKDPRSLPWLMDVAVSHKEVSQVLSWQGDQPGALAEAKAGLAAALQIVDIEPASASTRGTLEAAYESVGDVLFAQKDYAGAEQAFRSSYESDAAVAAADPTNTSAQRDLSVIGVKLGDLQLANKDYVGALATYRNAVATRAKLVAKDPTNAMWRRDLFYAHYEASKALRANSKTKDGLDELRVALAIADETATQHPSKASAQDDLAETHEEIGDVLVELHDLPGARAEYRAGLAVAKRMAARPDATPDWAKLVDKLQHDLVKAGDRPE
jgi:tetratricopeptide (TPR) repeat protein